MGSPLLNAPEPGTLVAGKYRVGEVLASGGMGVIVEAEHAALGQRVAIKFLRREAEDNPELVERFLREARAAARLHSDHVVRVFDVGTDDRGVPFLVMELLAGRDLGGEIAARGPLPAGEAVGYLVEALDAIVEAHAAGIVHRDLKPSNLFLAARADGSRRVKVLDFGISKSAPLAASDAVLTSSRSMLGSPAYMSPEQVRSTKTVDGRTDVWALGVILYELLTGEPAFRGETLGDIFARIREEDLPPIRRRRSDVPEGLAAVLEGCLQRDRALRIADAATLRARLLPFTAGGDRPAGALLPPAPAASARGVEATRWDGATLTTWIGDRGDRRRGRVWIGAALVLSAGALGTWLSSRAHPGRAEPLPAGASAVPAVHDAVADAPPPALAEAVDGGAAGEPRRAATTEPAGAVAGSAPSAPASAPRAPDAARHAGRHGPPPAAPPRGSATDPPPAPPGPKREDLGI